MVLSSTRSVLDHSLETDLFQWVTPEDDGDEGEEFCDLGPEDDDGDDSSEYDYTRQNLPPSPTDSDPTQPDPRPGPSPGSGIDLFE